MNDREHMKNRINKSLFSPTQELQSRIMQLSHNLNRRADILVELQRLHSYLGTAIGIMVRSNDREPLDEIYTDLDHLIQNEKRQLLQETKKTETGTEG